MPRSRPTKYHPRSLNLFIHLPCQLPGSIQLHNSFESRIVRCIVISVLLFYMKIRVAYPITTQQTRDIEPVLVKCGVIVFDAGPTLNQHSLNASCLLGRWYAWQTTELPMRQVPLLFTSPVCWDIYSSRSSFRQATALNVFVVWRVILNLKNDQLLYKIIQPSPNRTVQTLS